MRKIFSLGLITLIIIAAIYAILERGEGYILIAIAGYTIEMPVVVALIINVLFFFALYFAVGFLKLLFRTKRNVTSWAMSQRRQKGLNRTTQGLVAFVEGRWDFARRSLAKAANNSSTPLVNYLFAARASSAIGDAKAVDGFLKQAELSTEGAGVAIGLTQAELQIQNKQFEQALATLLRVKKQVHNHPVVLNLLADVYLKLSDWKSLIKLLPQLRHTLDDQKVGRLEQVACSERLKAAGKKGGGDALTACWKNLPSNAKKRPVIVADYAEQLIAQGLVEEAEYVVRHQLHRLYDTQLIEVYGRTLADNPARQLAYLEKLLKTYANDPELLMALGRVCRRMSKFGQAVDYFKKSVSVKERAVVYAELAKVYALQNNYKKSSECYARGAALQNGEIGLKLLDAG